MQLLFINTLNTDTCGSVERADHFKRIEGKFIEHANTLQVVLAD